MTNLTSTQKFIINSIVTNSDNNFIELSCIVPVYGADKYLEQCLLSILENSERNIEVIAINDGSPDNSKEILDNLAQKYKNLRAIHQDNIGGAPTINKGLDLAIGEYITIIDNDDWLEKDAIDILLDTAIKHNSSIVCSQIVKTWSYKKEIAFDTRYITKSESFKANKKPAVMNDGMYLGKIFNRKFLNSHNIRMDPTLLYADRPFVIVSFAEAEKITLIPKPLYMWRQREDSNNLSITDNMYSFKNVKDRIRSIRIMKFELEARGYNYWLDTIDYFNLNRIFWTMKSRKYAYLKEYSKIVRPYYNEINLSKMTNLTNTQKFITKTILDNSNEVFAALYVKRIIFARFRLLNLIKVPKGISSKFLSLSNKITKKYFQQSSKNPLKQCELLEETDNQIVVFESNFGKIYGAQPKYIYEELLKQNRAFRAVWVYQGKNKHTNIPGKVIQVHRGSKEYFNYLARAGYWVNNIRFTVTYKPKNTIYLNTWHGTPLKKLGLDIEVDGPEADARKSFLKESRSWDYLLAQNSFSEKTLQRAFDVKGNILTYGYPANEIFYRDNLQNISVDIKESLGIPEDKKVILYAPTWRDDSKIGDKWEYSFDLMIDIKEMQKRLGSDYVLLLRMHHLISDKLDLSDFKEFAFDISKYDDTSEILAISDILITDYSSIFFDFASLKRPILFFMYDLEKYTSELRGFYLDAKKDLPGPIIKNFEDLVTNIIDIDIDIVTKNYSDKYLKFYKTYCSKQDSNISKRVVDEVFIKLPTYVG